MKSFLYLRGAAPSARRQTGISLLVVLILLLVTAILGVAVLRSSAMQERMGANMRDRSLAFQAAEGALRYAQDQLSVAPNPQDTAKQTWDSRVPTVANCTNQSICPTNSAANWRAVPASTYDATRLAAAPEYWIEYLGQGPGYKGSCDTLPPSLDCKSPMFRVTVRSRASGRADVTLQSNITSRIPTPGT